MKGQRSRRWAADRMKHTDTLQDVQPKEPQWCDNQTTRRLMLVSWQIFSHVALN